MYKLYCIVAPQAMCAMSSCCVYKGRVEQMEARKTCGSFQCNDNAVLLLILYSCTGLTVLSSCCAVLGLFLPAG